MGINDHLLTISRAVWLFENSLLQSFMIDRQSVALPLEQLDRTASAIDKDEHTSIGNIPPHVFLNEAAEAIESLSKIHRSLEPVVPGISIKVQHTQPVIS